MPEWPSSSPLALMNSSGAPTGTHRAANFENSGPATAMVGMAMRTPRPSVTPSSAFSRPTAARGPGCGGTKTCITENAAAAVMP